jgi:hypothetical protein
VSTFRLSDTTNISLVEGENWYHQNLILLLKMYSIYIYIIVCILWEIIQYASLQQSAKDFYCFNSIQWFPFCSKISIFIFMFFLGGSAQYCILYISSLVIKRTQVMPLPNYHLLIKCEMFKICGNLFQVDYATNTLFAWCRPALLIRRLHFHRLL